MKIRKFIYTLFPIVFIFSCEEDPGNSISFRWEPSEFSRSGLSSFLFKSGDDNKLYCLGFVDNKYGVHSAETKNKWNTIVELEFGPGEPSVQDFAVYKQAVFFVRGGKLWKAKGSTIEQINFGNQITSVSHLNAKLIVVGELNDGSGNSYGIAYSEDALSFTLISPTEGSFAPPGYFLQKTNDKIFLASSDSYYEYDGIQLRRIEFRGGFSTVDANDFYSISSNYVNGVYQDYIKKWSNGITTNIGEMFKDEVDIRFLFFKDNSIIAIGDNSASGLSVAFSLDHNKWKPILTTNYFFGAFKYNNRVFAYTNDGIIAELVYDIR